MGVICWLITKLIGDNVFVGLSPDGLGGKDLLSYHQMDGRKGFVSLSPDEWKGGGLIGLSSDGLEARDSLTYHKIDWRR